MQRKRIQAFTVLGVGICVAMGALFAAQGLVDRKIEVRIYKKPHRTLEFLGKAQIRFFRFDRDEDGVKDFAASLKELNEGRCITEELASGEVGDYRYSVVEPTVPHGWAFRAEPAQVTTAALFYFMDQTFQVRAERGQPATPTSLVFYDPHDGLTGAFPLPESLRDDVPMPTPTRQP
tara:strand:- start:313 stop:843 length:531 start_codon:yes stop_codon:yes gene_type:complete